MILDVTFQEVSQGFNVNFGVTTNQPSGGDVLRLHATSDTTASHTSPDVHGHLEKGGYALFTYGEYIYTCVASSYGESTFIALMEDSHNLRMIRLDVDGNFDAFISTGGGSVDLSNYYTKYETDTAAYRIALSALKGDLDTTLSIRDKPADAKAVGDAIGDISSALTELHEYAEALKGGGSV